MCRGCARCVAAVRRWWRPCAALPWLAASRAPCLAARLLRAVVASRAVPLPCSLLSGSLVLRRGGGGPFFVWRLGRSRVARGVSPIRFRLLAHWASAARLVRRSPRLLGSWLGWWAGGSSTWSAGRGRAAGSIMGGGLGLGCRCARPRLPVPWVRRSVGLLGMSLIYMTRCRADLLAARLCWLGAVAPRLAPLAARGSRLVGRASWSCGRLAWGLAPRASPRCRSRLASLAPLPWGRLGFWLASLVVPCGRSRGGRPARSRRLRGRGGAVSAGD